MKKLILLILAFVAIATGSRASVVLNSTNFPDAAFRVYVSGLTGVSVGGTISDNQLDAVTAIYVSSKKILDLKGIEYFTKIKALDCSNNLLTSLDLSKHTALEILKCNANQLTLLDISKNNKLTEIDCSNNQLLALNLVNNTALTKFLCNSNGITGLNLDLNTALTWIECESNDLTSLNVSKNINLDIVDCRDNKLKSLVLPKNALLRSLDCEKNELETLDILNCTKLEFLYCSENKLTSLDLSTNTILKDLYCGENALESLDLSKCTKLNELSCRQNNLKSLDLSNCNVSYLLCDKNQLTSLKLFANNSKLKTLSCTSNSLRSLDLSGKVNLQNLWCIENNLSSLNLSDCELLEILMCHYNELAQLNLSKNVRLTDLSCGFNCLTNLDLSKNTLLSTGNTADAGYQTSTRRFQIMSNNGTTNNCWALYVGTSDATRIRYLKIDGVETEPKMLTKNPGWMVVSDDLKKIPKKVTYSYDTFSNKESAKWMYVTVNYDVKHYGVYVDGTELTSLNFYDIPGLKSGTAYLMDEHEGIGWSGIVPTLVLNNAKIAGEKGIVNEDCYNLKIIASGDNEVTATDYNGFANSGAAVKTVFSGGGTIRFTATGGSWHGIYAGDYTITELTEGTKVICKGDGYGYFDDCGRLYIKENSALMAYGNQNPSVELPKESDRHFDSNIAIRYPVGATYDDKYSVCYAGTTTKVQKDWVVIGPPGAEPPSNPYDLNGDEKVSTADIQVIINEMKKPQASQDMKYDLNNDGKISTADIQVIINEMKK